LKNLTDHFLENGSGAPPRSPAIRPGVFSGARAATRVARHAFRNGMVVISSTIAAGPIAQTRLRTASRLAREEKRLERAFPRFADDLTWWIEAAKAQRARRAPPY